MYDIEQRTRQLKAEYKRLNRLDSRMNALLRNAESSSQTPRTTGSNWMKPWWCCWMNSAHRTRRPKPGGQGPNSVGRFHSPAAPHRLLRLGLHQQPQQLLADLDPLLALPLRPCPRGHHQARIQVLAVDEAFSSGVGQLGLTGTADIKQPTEVGFSQSLVSLMLATPV